MRRLCPSLILAGLFQMWSPAPAQAWWEWLDELSGPQGLKGPQFEARLVCFGNELPANLSGALAEPRRLTAAARIIDPSDSLEAAMRGLPGDGRTAGLTRLQDGLRAAAPAWAAAEQAWENRRDAVG